MDEYLSLMFQIKGICLYFPAFCVIVGKLDDRCYDRAVLEAGAMEYFVLFWRRCYSSEVTTMDWICDIQSDYDLCFVLTFSSFFDDEECIPMRHSILFSSD